MKSSDGGVARFNRWFSPSTGNNTDQDPWMDLAQTTDDADEVKMAFDDDFHLTVIPNFLHDSDAYIANLEDRLERLRQVNPNPSPTEILATMTQARTLRTKNAELNPELNAKPSDDTGEGDDAGFMTMWPALFAVVSRRFFPRLALTKEETQHLLKYDRLLAQYQDEMNNNDIRNDEAEGYEVRDVDTVPDTSWKRRDRDSSNEQSPAVESPDHELSYLRFDSPEAHEIQIPKNWVCDEAHQEIQQDATPIPEYSTNECQKVNRSALSLLVNTNAITQEASTITSFTPTKRSEDAFYNFAYIKTSMTTQDSVRVGTPAVYPSSVGHADSHSKSKIASQDKIPLTAAACNVNLSENQYASSVPISDEKEAKVVSKSSANVSEVTTKEETILTTKSSPSLKPTRDSEVKDMSLTEGDKDEVPQDMGEDKERGQSASTKSQTQLPTTEDEQLHGSNRSSSSQIMASKDSSVHSKALQSMIVPEVTVASSSTQESVVVQQPQCKREEEDKKALAQKGHSIHGPDITVPEVMVASSSTHESMAAGFEGPWFDKESDMSLGNTGEDLLQHMSSLVRASVDEYDEPPMRVSGNQTSQLSGGCTQLSSTGMCSDITRSKASEGTSGNYTTNYSDPHSNLFEEESNIKKDEGQAPIIRMYGHVALQGNLRLWPPQRGGIDNSRDSHEAVSARLLPLPQAKRNVAERTSAVMCEDDLPNTKKEDDKNMSVTPWQHTKTKSNEHSEESQTALKVPVISNTECRKVPSTKSEYWSSRSRSSASSVASSAVTSTRSTTEEEVPMKAAASKLSTSSTFKSRQRSVHWFQTIEDVDCDTVVRDCDYLSTSQMKIKARIEDVKGQHTVKNKGVTSKKVSKHDHSEGSRVREACKKFTAHVLEEEGIVASKVYSFPEFFGTSCSKEQGTAEAVKDIVIITKDDEKSAAIESVEVSESFEAQSEAECALTAQKDLTAASESDENAAIYITKSSESVERQDVNATVPRTIEGLAAAENDGVNSVVDSARLSQSLEGPLSKDSPIGSREHLRDTAETKMQTADDPEMRPVSRYRFTAVPNGEQSRETVGTMQESLITDKACQKQDVPLKKVDKETQVMLDGGSENTNDDVQAQINTPAIYQRCSPMPTLRHEEKTTQSKATENEYGQSSSSASCARKECNDKKSVQSKEDKQEPAEGQERINEDASFSKDTTVLRCHELVTASRFTRFPASNRNSAPIQRSLNITRTLRITTTNQFKPLNLRHSITGALNNSSSFIGRPLSIQSREVVPPRTLPQQHHDRGLKALHENEDSAAPCLEPARSSSCKDIVEATNTEPSATGQALAHRSRSFHGVASEGTEGLKKVTSENTAYEPTHPTGNDRHSDTALEGAAGSGGILVNDSLNHEQGNASSAQDQKAAAVDGYKVVQLPFKKRMCCRLAQSSEILETRGTLNNDSTSDKPLQMQDAEHRMAGITKDMKTVGCDEVTARLDAVFVTEANVKKLDINKDATFLNEEYPIQGAHVDRTISLIDDSQYSMVGAAEISHASPISIILGGDMNVETAKLCALLPSASDCATSTASKDDTLQNDSFTTSTMSPEEAALTVNDGMSANINTECLTKPVGKPTPLKRQKKGGERDADAEDDGSWTDLSVLSEADATDQDESSKPLSQLGTNDTPDDQCLPGGSSDT